MAFRPLNPLPSPDEVLRRLDPKPGETYGYISREDVRFGWIYFLTILRNLDIDTGGKPKPDKDNQCGAPPWSIRDSYTVGDLVFYKGQVYRAAGDIATLGPVPDMTSDWQPVGTEPTVSVALAAGQDPTNFRFTGMPREGDILFNLPDKHTWIFGPQGWQHVLTPPVDSVFGGMLVVNAAPAHQFEPDTLPTNDPAFPGTYYVAAEEVVIPATFPTASLRGVTVRPGDWLVDDGFNWVWIQMSQEPQVYTTTDVTGDTPATWVFGTSPINGDMFVNTTDHRHWVRMPDPSTPAASLWVELTTPLPTVTTSTTAGETPTTNPPANPQERDWFVNLTDGLAWLAIDDPANAGTPLWQQISTLPPVVTSFTAGAGASVPAPDDDPNTHVFTDPPRPGDIYVVHNADGRSQTWIAIPGFGSYQPVFWQHTASLPPQYTLSQTSGETPTAPGTATLPTQTDAGDIFINHADSTMWVAVPDAAGTAIEWQLVGSASEQFIVSQTSGETPILPGTATMPATTNRGDVFVNHSDGLVWLAVPVFNTGNAIEWQPLNQAPDVTVSTTPGENPTGALTFGPHIGAWIYAESGTMVNGHFDDDGAGTIHLSDQHSTGTPPAALLGAISAGDILRLKPNANTYTDYTVGMSVQDQTAGRSGYVITYTSKSVTGMPVAVGVATPLLASSAGSSTPLAGRRNDEFINTADGLAWVYADDTGSGSPGWVPLPEASMASLTVTAQASIEPSTYQPSLTPEAQDLFVNQADKRVWLAVEDLAAPGTVIWQEVGGERPQVTVSTLPGDAPTTHLAPLGTWTRARQATVVAPATIQVRGTGPGTAVLMEQTDLAGHNEMATLSQVQVGDTVRIRDASGVNGYDVDVTVARTTRNPNSQTDDLLMLNGTVTVVGTAPAVGAALTVTFPSGALTPKRDDVFVNKADALTWVYADDDGSGSPGWVLLSSAQPRVTVSTVAGEDPFAASLHALDGWTFVDPAGSPPVTTGQGQLRSDRLLLSATDAAGADKTAALAAIPPGRELEINDVGLNAVVITVDSVTTSGVAPDLVYEFAYTTTTGAFTHAYPFQGMISQNVPRILASRDDVFINTQDAKTWVYADDDGTGRPGWVALPSGSRPGVTVSNTAGDDPTTGFGVGFGSWVTAAGPTPAVGEMVVTPTTVTVHITDGNGDNMTADLSAIASGSQVRLKAIGANDWVNFDVTSVAPAVGGATTWTATGTITRSHGGAQPLGTAIELVHDLPQGDRNDVFINTKDDKTWVYADDDGNGTPGWVRIGGARVTTSPNPSATPTTITPALSTPDAGDVFINTNDKMTWIYDGENSQWLPLSSAAVSGLNLLGIIAAPNPDYELGTWELAAGGSLANGKFTISQLSPGDLTLMPYDAGGANHEVDILNMNIVAGDKIVMQSLTDPDVRILCDVQSVAPRTGGASNAFVFNGHIETSWQSGQSVAAPPSTMRFGLEKYEPHQTAWADLAYELRKGQLTPGGYLMVDHIRDTGNPALPGLPAATPMNIGDWLVALDSDGDGTSDRFHLVRHDKPPTPGVTVGEIKMWPTTHPPADHFICDGTIFSATQYPELARVLGGNRLPDMRDRFVRGYNPNGNKGGVKTTHEWLTGKPRTQFRTNTVQSHRHEGWYRDPGSSGGPYDGTGSGSYFSWQKENTEPSGGHDHYIWTGGDAETRPDNIIMAFIIQAR